MSEKKRDFIRFAMFVLPALGIYSLFFAYPIARGFFYSFTYWEGFGDIPRFNGLTNYIDLFKDDLIHIALKNNLIISVVVIIVQNVLALSFAILLNQKMKGHMFFRAIIFFPVLLSSAVIGYIWDYIYSPLEGVLHTVFSGLGYLSAAEINWLGDPTYALFSICAVIIWQYTGYSMVIYIAGLQTIPKDLYEAAEIDGAGSWKKFTHITIPLLASSFTINMMISVIGCLKLFDQVYLLTQGGPAHQTEVFGTLIYSIAFKSQQLGYGTALAMALTFLILVISSTQYYFMSKREVEY
ncbi:sugar ABC transporter permease [Paenibacillus psychroresistens]|uniref:Sugar ABC transporter permease n=1 Tax=Paenibacillus psychroresistens TaxID=1778678 RepID=A0A6B8RHP9_9BACL|nr:sugar ABC transporter permease [Paenibacillus psychroresistens]QGQ95125.1 sugar ABC transporter permease [Paenibacillus psychroresistens]